MAIKMVMPLLGQTMEEGTIIQWFKKEGDEIKQGEPLLEVMTDKVNMEVEAPQSGVLRKVLAQPDAVVPVKDPIAIIGTADEPIDDLLAGEGQVREGEAPAEPVTSPEAEKSRSREAEIAGAATPSPGGEGGVRAGAAGLAQPVPSTGDQGRVIASPAARRAAREQGIDIAVLAGRGTGPGGRIQERDVVGFAASAPRTTPLAGRMAADMGVDVAAVTGTGVGGRITSQDVERAAAPAAPAMPPAAPAAPAAIGAEIPFSGMRKMIAQNVSASYQQAVHVTLVAEVDMTECVRLRAQILDDMEKRYGVRISYTDIIAKAAARAILDKPIVNASLQDDRIVIHDHVNIGIATALEQGLVVPVVKDVQSKSLPQVSADIKDLVSRARAGKSGPDDFRGGTFTITNLGGYGIDSFNPIITPGQSAILAVCRIAEKPAVVGGQIVARSMMNLCLSFDHRVMDGAPAAEFLARLRELLEAPYLIFM